MPIFNLFIPHRHTKKRSSVLQQPVLLSYVFFVFALIFSSYLIISAVPNILGYATNISTSDLLRYTNEKRSNNGVGHLSLNSTLSRAAEAKANDMFANDYWAHTSPSGKEPWDFIVASGYDYLYAGENLAVDFSESKSVVRAWEQSPTHNANLINEKYTEIGFAVVDGELEGRKTTLVVQMFGYPRGGVAKVSAPQEPVKVPAEIEVPTEVPIEVPIEVQADIPVDVNLAKIPNVAPAGLVLNSSDVFSASRYLAIILGFFLTIMFAIDGYYVRRHGVFRISGHTIFHVLILLLVIGGIWYTSIGLVL